ncbi:hypothetical protein HYPSUDRAFT_34122 [Hypholoma sublateritium FD-334 SS-4]|uniref:WLM domain-containing protein n=1 Tax=Hypholoma sublateritium (strain FD-334 SS-4) TaxID=945553 RepID=A0A0D2QAL5_HYPSF|nr:hypothetical protein HYPSUDRAFT_34122 [Hypholoma sublateritium FD-334 SS-4]
MRDTFVQSFTHLKDKPNADKALHILQRVASLVKPIMRKRAWVLPVFSEFFPDNPNLLGLNVNAGQKILVRLRPPFSPDTFLLEDDVVQTMLHELTHNVHGPHDDKFYKYLSSLQDEYDDLQRSGYAGEGFFSAGHRLGTNVSHNVPPNVARIKALEAAEKRVKMERVLNGGGRLGGRSRNTGLSPRELAARAAEQRSKDQKSCGAGVGAEREAEIAATQSVENKVIDLTLDDTEYHHGSNSDSDVVIVRDVHIRPTVKGSSNAVAGSSKSRKQAAPTVRNPIRDAVPPRKTSVTNKSSAASPNNSSLSTHTQNPRSTHISRTGPPPAQWACPMCTLLNPANLVHCDACTARKPLDKQQGWSCLTCGEVGISHEFWMCGWCGEVKLNS